MAVEICDLTVAFGDTLALDHISLAVPSGRLCAIMGPNGGGKTTLIKAMLGLTPSTGSVRIAGEPYARQRHRVGYVPQRASLDWNFPATALETVQTGTYGRLGLFQRVRAQERATALRCLEHVGLADAAQRPVRMLSGGQQQRVLLARALAQQAEVYLLDEPFAGVDAPSERTVIALLQTLCTGGRTVICVHHDMASAPAYFDWLILLNTRLIAAGPFASTFTPHNVQATYSGHAIMPPAALQHHV
jgi:manganese/zinc/iron transport system ATP- binding protein